MLLLLKVLLQFHPAGATGLGEEQRQVAGDVGAVLRHPVSLLEALGERAASAADEGQHLAPQHV